jgi:cytochrome c peroxidase
LNYQEVYNDIAALLDAPEYDDGSYGPVLVRLAWHASGTYDKNTGTGGSNGATMRFDPEASHGANAGLAVARYAGFLVWVSISSALTQNAPVFLCQKTLGAH